MLTQPTIDIVKAVTFTLDPAAHSGRPAVFIAGDEKLRGAGVPDTAINYECFGPLQAV